MNTRVYAMLNKKMFGQSWGLSVINGYCLNYGYSAYSRGVILPDDPSIYQFRYVQQIDHYIEEI